MNSITVGTNEGNVQGATGEAIQQAIDHMHTVNGGTVEVLPGVYYLHDAIRLKPNITLKGTAGKTILKRAPLALSKLTCDADRGQRAIYPEDPSRFKVGMGVGLFDRKSSWTKLSSPYRVVAVHDDHIEIDTILTEERFEENDGVVLNFFPMLQAQEADHSCIEGFEVDGTSRFEHDLYHAVEKEVAESFHNPPPYFSERISPPRTSLVFHQTSRHCRVSHVHAFNGDGDGFCFSMASEYMVMRHCEADHNGWYGVHPGSHSAFADISHCHIHHNFSDGLYICWGMHNGTITNNNCHDNGWEHWRSGMSIGHKDTDNLIENNTFSHNGRHGICIRNKTPQNAPHRCTYRNNVIENNGSLPDEIMDVKSKLPESENIRAQVYIGNNVKDLVFQNNDIRETREAYMKLDRTAFLQSPSAARITIENNKLEGIETLLTHA